MTGRRKKVTIKKIVSETKDCKTLVLEVEDDSFLPYKAGQFLTFIFNTPFGEQRRNYSLSSAPDLNEPVSITIKRIPNGFFSRELVDRAKTGDVLTTIGASGFFTIPGNISEYKQFFLFAAGSGITPVFSILKTVLKNFPQVEVILIYSNHSVTDAIFYTKLKNLEQQHSQLKIEWLFSNVPDHTKARLSNWLLGELLKKYVTASLSACLFYICGPFNYMRMISITLLSRGVKAGNIRKEEFVITETRILLQPPDTTVRRVTVILNKKQYWFNSSFPQTILQSAKRENIELPYSCETGRCGTCAATCINGNVWMKYNEVLTDEDLRRKKVLTCTGYPVYGDVELDFDEI